jgi:hypothetical protein
MNSDIQMVVNICIELSDRGKQPSVGMIKAKSPNPLPIPLIIKGISYWKENKDSLKKVVIANEEKSQQSTVGDETKRIEQLELYKLSEEMKRLKYCKTRLQTCNNRSRC